MIQDSMSRDIRITEIRSWNGMYCIPSSAVSDHRITMVVFYRSSFVTCTAFSYSKRCMIMVRNFNLIVLCFTYTHRKTKCFRIFRRISEVKLGAAVESYHRGFLW